MKTDVLTLAALVFIVGLLASSFGVTDVFKGDQSPVGALQQGVATR